MAEFKSSITRGGSTLTPHTITVTDDSVMWKKRNANLIGSDSKTIPLESVATIEIDEKTWGANITITSFGLGRIYAENFTGSDAKAIKNLIEEKKGSSKKSNSSQREDREPVEIKTEKVLLKELELEEKMEERREKHSNYVDPEKIALLTFGNDKTEIIAELNKLKNLLVTKRKDSYKYKPKDQDMAYVAKIQEGIRKLNMVAGNESGVAGEVKFFEEIISKYEKKWRIKKYIKYGIIGAIVLFIFLKWLIFKLTH